MRITKCKLRQIIKECLISESSFSSRLVENLSSSIDDDPLIKWCVRVLYELGRARSIDDVKEFLSGLTQEQHVMLDHLISTGQPLPEPRGVVFWSITRRRPGHHKSPRITYDMLRQFRELSDHRWVTGEELIKAGWSEDDVNTLYNKIPFSPWSEIFNRQEMGFGRVARQGEFSKMEFGQTSLAQMIFDDLEFWEGAPGAGAKIRSLK